MSISALEVNPDDERDTAHRAFVASMQHELRTPANAVVGYASGLREHLSDAVGAEDGVERLAEAGDRLNLLIDAFLSQSISGGADQAKNVKQFRHDAASALQIIDGYAELMLDEPAITESERAFADLNRILRASRRVRGVMDQMHTVLTSDCSALPANTDSKLIYDAVTTLRNLHSRADEPLGSGTVMVVEDDESNRELLARQLDKLGYAVVHAFDGLEALNLLRKQAVDAILLDIIMPRMNGYQTLAALRADERLRDIPVIIISAFDDSESVTRCIEMGADEYMPKRFDPTLLKARLKGCLEKKRLRDIEREYHREIEAEREKSERLLLNVLPEPTAARLKRGEAVIADAFEDVSVLFADLSGFTAFAATRSAFEVVASLNTIFQRFDELVTKRKLEKIKTIGDAYMLAGGIPEPNAEHLENVAGAAMEMLAVAEQCSETDGIDMLLRVGINTGPVVAGVIGTSKFAYDLWGDTVNVASRMESLGAPGRVHVTQAVRDRLLHRYEFEQLEPMVVKGKGLMQTYLIK